MTGLWTASVASSERSVRMKKENCKKFSVEKFQGSSFYSLPMSGHLYISGINRFPKANIRLLYTTTDGKLPTELILLNINIA